MSEDDPPIKGDQYHHPDGTREVVYLLEDGRVLTFSEYPSVETFEAAMENAVYHGLNEEVVDLPGLDAFEGSDDTNNGGAASGNEST